jgi:two-component system LytT family response regulator
MLNCIIIDDELNCREDLQAVIDHQFKGRIHVAGTASSVKEGVTIINQTMPDVVFLDIRMPVEDGFKLFSKFDYITFEVVFTTSYEEYALQAIKHAAFDYLIKPVDPDDLNSFLERYEKQTKRTSANNKIKMLLDRLESGKEPNILVSLPMGKEFKVVNANNILYCKANVNYTEIYINDGSKILVSKTLGIVEKILAYPFFFRCHKSYLVNLNYIDSYNKSDGYVRIKNDEVIYLATRRIEDFINLFGQEKPY